MKLFLTGDIQIGKTTALNKALRSGSGSGGSSDCGDCGGVAGLVTYGGPAKADGTRDVYLKAWGAPDAYDDDHRICERLSPSGRKAYPEVFETTGAAILREALAAKPELIVLDELGVFEENCAAFKAAVFECLSSSIPVLGVLKKAASGFLDEVREAAGVEVLEVTRENRDSVALLIADKLQASHFRR